MKREVRDLRRRLDDCFMLLEQINEIFDYVYTKKNVSISKASRMALIRDLEEIERLLTDFHDKLLGLEETAKIIRQHGTMVWTKLTREVKRLEKEVEA